MLCLFIFSYLFSVRPLMRNTKKCIMRCHEQVKFTRTGKQNHYFYSQVQVLPTSHSWYAGRNFLTTLLSQGNRPKDGTVTRIEEYNNKKKLCIWGNANRKDQYSGLLMRLFKSKSTPSYYLLNMWAFQVSIM